MIFDFLKRVLPVLGMALLSPSLSWAQQAGGQGNYYGPHMMWGDGWMGGFSMIIFWILVIAAIYFAIRWTANSGKNLGSGGLESAIDVLRRRYASGELDRETYLSMKKDLEN